MKRMIEMLIATAVIISLIFVNPVRAYTFYSEHGGAASITMKYGSPEVVGEYTTNVLKLGVEAEYYEAATANGSMYVYGVAESSGWVTGTLKWYMKGVVAASSSPTIAETWIIVKFQAIDLTAGTLVEKVLLNDARALSQR